MISIRRFHETDWPEVWRILQATFEAGNTYVFSPDSTEAEIRKVGAASPFVFVWDRDVAGCLVRAIADGPAGVYNVAGDGTMTMEDIAAAMGKRPRYFSARLLRAGLGVLRPLGLSRYGPEQVGFLQYRPVLDNTRLKTVFGYVPRKTSQEAFESWRERSKE